MQIPKSILVWQSLVTHIDHWLTHLLYNFNKTTRPVALPSRNLQHMITHILLHSTTGLN